MRTPIASPHRPLRGFWVLLAIAALAMGVLSDALTKAPGPLTGLTVAGSGIILLIALALACRTMIALDHARRPRSRRRRRRLAQGAESVRKHQAGPIRR